MDSKELPVRPNLEQYKKQAKDLVKVFKDFGARQPGDPETIQRIKKYHPRPGKLPEPEIRNAKFAPKVCETRRSAGSREFHRFTIRAGRGRHR